MKKRKVSAFLFKIITILPLVLMLAALVFAYLSNIQFDKPQQEPSLGTLNANISWKVLLKENQFFPTNELGSDYAFIKELVDRLQFDIKFDLSGAPADATVKINYRVDGVLQANYEASSNGLLLMREYPQIDQNEEQLSEENAAGAKQFELPLSEYTVVIESFQNAYRVGVKSKLDLKINVDAVMESGGKSIEKSIPLNLSIPLDSSVFQISGSPSNKVEFTVPAPSTAPSGWAYGTTLYYLGAAVIMLLTTIAVFLLFSPLDPAPELTLLKQAMQKCKGSLVAIKANPKDADLPMLPVESMDGLVNISESTGQPILYYNKMDEHLFLVSSDEILYAYELHVGVETTDAKHEPSHGETVL